MLKAKRGQQLIEKLPAERILTETDGPFTQISNNPARPKNVSEVVKSLGELKRKAPDEMGRIILLNLKNILKS